MEIKELNVKLTRDISEGLTDLLYALTLTIRRENPHDIYMLQREAVNIFSTFGQDEVALFMDFMVSLHKPFCTATDGQMDSGRRTWRYREN